jgi:hypothetical protein
MSEALEGGHVQVSELFEAALALETMANEQCKETFDSSTASDYQADSYGRRMACFLMRL